MEKIGESFRILRIERGFTLKTMSTGIVSFSYLSKFEKGQSQISLVSFVKLVQRLNMTVDEFMYYNGTRTTEYTDFFQKIAKAYAENSVSELKGYLKKEEDLYEKTSIHYHQYNAIMIGAIIKEIDPKYEVDQADIEIIVDSILKCSYWTTYEVSLFGNVLVFFSDDLLVVLLEEIKQKITKHQVMQRNYRDLIRLVGNACLIFLRNKKVKQAKALSEFLETVIRQDHYFEKTRKLFIDGLIEIGLGNEKAGQEKAMQAIEIMHLIDEVFVESHQVELERIEVLYASE